ncbi:hypothetical protein [Tumebacillus permanentifrigoris]|uniref:Uncharacterized protein n=1 Tax=Tumebacillus permanentifrigoris TaxID=378543 RepID=A0A316D2G3_9BACL|nr:hypothetical protein [Tumebacillus permanentifrigoris]PWK05076.1 hypothetical protein C7459_1278 [Tumebacillus permanentifrigoris]
MSNWYLLRNAVEDLTYLRKWTPEYRKIVLRHHTGNDNLSEFVEADFRKLFRGLEVDPYQISKIADSKRNNSKRREKSA